MADVEESGPLAGQPFTDSDWRDSQGGEGGIVQDHTGTAYDLTLPGASDVAELGSAAVRSICRIGGFRHVIPMGTTHSVTIPPSTDGTVGRTDRIAVELDLATYTTEPGPARLVLLQGTEGSTSPPATDPGPPGVEHVPLYQITRIQGDPLNVASVVDMRRWISESAVTPDGSPVPTNAPLGLRIRRGVNDYLRDLVGGVPTWINLTTEVADKIADAVKGLVIGGVPTRAGATSRYVILEPARPGAQGDRIVINDDPSLADTSERIYVDIRDPGASSYTRVLGWDRNGRLARGSVPRARLEAPHESTQVSTWWSSASGWTTSGATNIHRAWTDETQGGIHVGVRRSSGGDIVANDAGRLGTGVTVGHITNPGFRPRYEVICVGQYWPETGLGRQATFRITPDGQVLLIHLTPSGTLPVRSEGSSVLISGSWPVF